METIPVTFHWTDVDEDHKKGVPVSCRGAGKLFTITEIKFICTGVEITIKTLFPTTAVLVTGQGVLFKYADEFLIPLSCLFCGWTATLTP